MQMERARVRSQFPKMRDQWIDGVLVLLYHGLSTGSRQMTEVNPADRSVIVTAREFERQLEAIEIMPCDVVNLSDLVLPANGSSESTNADKTNGVQKFSVLLTFDDGHVSNWTVAVPRLVARNMTATFYVISERVDHDKQHLNAAQLREMVELGMTIGSHTHRHRWLTELSNEEVRYELETSKKILEDIVQKPVVDFALPGGHFNRRILEIAAEVGYETTATCEVGVVRPGTDLGRIPRVEIRRQLTIQAFYSTFSWQTIRRLRRWTRAKTILRDTVGLARYSRMREFVHKIVPIVR